MPLPNQSGIYQIKNLANGKCYVGSAKCFRVRWKLHRGQLNSGKHHSKKMQRAWNKYGELSFEFTILEEVEAIANKLVEREQFWMDKLQAVKNGYNVAPTAGSALGVKRSASTRRKMVAIRHNAPITKQQHQIMTKARKNSLAFKAHVRQLHERNVGRTVSEVTRSAISAAGIARWKNPEYRAFMVAKSTGRSHTAEARAKISLKKKGLPLTNEHRSKLSLSHKGYRPSLETRERLSIAQKARHARERLEREQLPESMRKKKSGNRPTLSKAQLQKMEEGRRNSLKFAEHLRKLHASNKGRSHTDAAKKRMSIAQKIVNQDPTYRLRVSATHKGRKVSEETRERMRIAALVRESRKRSELMDIRNQHEGNRILSAAV